MMAWASRFAVSGFSGPGGVLEPETRHREPSAEAGVVLIVVLWVILLLSLLIGGFAFTMHVETELTSFHRKQLKAEMIARSGVEVAQRILARQASSATAGNFDARNQDWVTNQTFLVNRTIGDGVLNVTMTDEESKFPINRATPEQIRRLLDLLGVDPVDGDVIADSIADWIDPDDLHLLNGAESDYYLSLSPPYRAKNAPLDRVEELLLVRGVTRELMYGQAPEGDTNAVPWLVDLLTTTSSGRLNVNTASPLVLRALLGLDDTQLDAVLNKRNGGDGVNGTDDDQPFQSLSEFYSLLGVADRKALDQAGRLLTVQSSYFTIRSTGRVGNVTRTVRVIVRRNGDQVLPVTWQAGEAN